MQLIAEIPVISPVFQAILDGIGQILSWIYDVVPNYGIAIIILTVLVRLVLLPLGVKQIRSMHSMQTLQPKIKALQTKYKGNKTKAQEEIMKLYKESGVNPLSGCWPVILQFPILIAMYAVLRPPILNADFNKPGTTITAADYTNNHLPPGSTLYTNITTHQNTDFLWMNLQCSAIQSGTGQVALKDSKGQDIVEGLKNEEGQAIAPTIDCGKGVPVRIPYYAFLLLMIATTFFQQRQMQQAAPPGSQNPQQQALFKMMPILFGVFGIAFPSALVLYWTTSNAWQIGQQAVMLKLGHIGPGAAERTQAARAAKAAKPGGRTRKGLMASLAERAEQERARRAKASGGKASGGKASGGKPSGGKPSGDKPSGGKASGRGSAKKTSGDGRSSSGAKNVSGRSPKKGSPTKGKPSGSSPGGAKSKPASQSQDDGSPRKDDDSTDAGGPDA